MPKISNLFLGLPLNKKRKQTYKIYHQNISMIKMTHKEYFALMFIFNRFGSIFRKKNNLATYEGALLNQTIVLTVDDMKYVDKNATRINSMIEDIISSGFIKRVDKTSYLVNPLYSDNLSSKQVKFANDIINKEFGN